MSRYLIRSSGKVDLRIHKYFSVLSLSSSSSFNEINLHMKKLIDSKQYRRALELFDHQANVCDNTTFTLALKACSKLNDYQSGIRIHQQLSLEACKSSFIQSSLIHFYMQCGDANQAHKIFSSIENKSVYIYGAMFKGYISNNMPEKVIEVFETKPVEPDEVLIILLFNACAKVRSSQAIKLGKETFSQLPSAYLQNPKVINSAIDMFMKFRDVNEAEDIFEKSEKKDTVTYGLMMQGYAKNKLFDKALDLFKNIPLKPDEFLYATAFRTCASLSNERAIRLGKEIFDKMPKIYLQNILPVSSAIHMFMEFGEVATAEYLCSKIKQQNPYIFGALIQGYVKNNLSNKAVDLLENFPSKSNEVLYTTVYKACASMLNERVMQLGKKIFNNMPNKYLESIVLVTAAIHMFMSFGEVETAEYLFSKIKTNNRHSYGAMMNGYNINKQPHKCLSFFKQIKTENLIIDEGIAVSLIRACSQIGIRSICENILHQISIPKFSINVNTALIDMWGKSGDINRTKQVFESMPQHDIATYNSMVNAYGRNGMGHEAIDLYNKIPENIRDQISHVCVLNACSHSGLVDQAQIIFNKIEKKSTEVITTMVDCLSRMAMFDEAEKLIDDFEQSNSPYFVMHCAMLSGARNHGHVALAEKVYNRMLLVFPNEKSCLISASILLSNTYSSIGNNEKAELVRINRLKQFGNKVEVGVSWTEVNGQVVRFKAHDRSHPQSDKIYAEIERLSNELKEHGHQSDSSWVTRPLKPGETVDSVLCTHSERLAMAFNFIQTPRPSVIQITKNLRICGDCHRATKLIAKIRQCEIIVRDANRVHHFHTNGQCSCQDHF